MVLPVDDNELSRLVLFQGVNPEFIRDWMEDCTVESIDQGVVVLSPEKQNRKGRSLRLV